MNFRFLCYLLILVVFPQGALHAQELASTDKIEIIFKAELLVKEFEGLLNIVSNPDLNQTEIRDLITNSYESSTNQLFVDGKAIIEDDLDPNQINVDIPKDLTIDGYLRNLDLLYTKSDTPSISFGEIKVSKIYENDYQYVKVYFESQFRNRHTQSNTPFPLTRRIAEVRADRIDKQWETQIVSIVFYDPATPIEEADYEENQFTSIQVRQKIDSEQTVAIETIYRESIKEEVQRLVEEDKEKVLAACYELREQGDIAFEQGDYEKALEAYEEARSVYRYEVSVLKKIRETKAVIAAKDEKFDAQFLRYLKQASYAESLRDYPRAIDEYEKAQEINPAADSVSEQIKLLQQKQINLSRLKSKSASGDYLGTIRDFNRAIREFTSDPDLFFWRGHYFQKTLKIKQAMQDYSQAIQLAPDFYGAYLERAVLYEQMGEIALAIADLSMAISLYVDGPDLFVRRAKLNLRMEKRQNAIADYGEAIITKPNAEYLYLERGQLHFFEQSYAVAIEDFTKTIQLDSLLVDGYFYRGKSYIETGDVVQAAHDFHTAQRLGLDDISTRYIHETTTSFYDRAMFSQGNQDHEKAIVVFTHAVTLQEKFADAWYGRGISHVAIRDLFTAIDDFTQALSADSSYYIAYYERGKAYATLGMFPSAISDLEQATAINSDFYLADIYLGDIYTKLEAYKKAIPIYVNVLSNNPSLFGLRLKLGKINWILKEYADAVSNLSLYIKSDQHNSEAFFYRGEAYYYLGEFKKASSDFSDAVKLSPAYSVAYFARGKIFMATQEWRDAWQDFSQAINHDTSFVDAYWLRGRANARLTSYEQALEDYLTVLELSPTKPAALFFSEMGIIYLELGRPDEAKATLDEAYVRDATLHQTQYGFARYHALNNQPAEALEWLERALRAGQYDFSEVKNDPYFIGLKKDSRFKAALKKYLK